MISTARSTEPTGAATSAESVTKRTYRVVDPNALGTLRWNTPPPQVNVYIESQLMLHPDFAEWTAVLDYDILGGSLDSLPVRIPTAWAPKAQGELVGGGGDFKTSEFGPLTFWRVVPDRPAWGHRRLVIRSSMPLTPGQEIQHPEIRPLGLGRVDIYLRLVTAAGTTPTTEGSNSLKEVMDAGRFTDPDFWTIPGTRGRVFHVARDNWSLKVQVPSSAGDPGPRASAFARVASADLSLTVLDDETLIGRAIYDTQAGNGRFFMAAPPRNSRLLWATVDQIPSRPFTAEDGRWHVPLLEGLPHRVCVYWSGPLDSPVSRSAPGRPSDRSEWTLELPGVGSGPVPTLVTIRAAEDLAVQPSLSELEPISTAQMELERANRISRQLNDLLGQMDRRSGRERERVISLVIAHELAIRGAERSLRQSSGRGDGAFRDRADRELEVVRSARKVFVDALRAAALDDELEAALSYLGQSAATNRSRICRL